MPEEPTFAETMVSNLETLLAENVGLEEVAVGGPNGTRTKYADLLKQYDYWKKRVANESGTRQRIVRLDLSGGV